MSKSIPQKPKDRNYVAKNSRSMSGAGAHKDKHGERSSRTRQKRDWKKDMNDEDKLTESINKQIKTLLDKGKTVRSAATGRMGNVTEVNGNKVYINRQGRKGGETSFDQGDKVEIVKNNDEYIIKNIIEHGSMIEQFNESLVFDNSNDFEQALWEIEKEFGIDLSEGIVDRAKKKMASERGSDPECKWCGNNFPKDKLGDHEEKCDYVIPKDLTKTAGKPVVEGDVSHKQKLKDMDKIMRHYGKSTSRDNIKGKIGDDLEQLGYNPDEIEDMIHYIMTGVSDMWREQQIKTLN